jgi:hypothetical protein
MTVTMRHGVVVLLAAIGFLTLSACGDDEPVATSTTEPTLTSDTTTTAPAGTTSTEGTTATTTGSTLEAVSFIDAGSGGGSGEIALNWEGVEGATGYRVLRATTPGGPFEQSADLNVVTGDRTLADDVVSLWSPTGDFPPFTTVPGEEPPPRYQYIELVSGGVTQRYFKVVAYDDDGEGPASEVVCGAAQGQSSC